MRKAWLLCLIPWVVVLGCRTTPSVVAERTQLQVRQVQTRNYETRDRNGVMKAVLNVLQDDGFFVQNANTELGLITASKTFRVSSLKEEDLKRIYGLENPHNDPDFASIEATVNVNRFGDQMRVRVNFLIKLFHDMNKIETVGEITAGTYYQEFFTKVDKGIFIEREKI